MSDYALLHYINEPYGPEYIVILFASDNDQKNAIHFQKPGFTLASTTKFEGSDILPVDTILASRGAEI